jgi:glycosyltransferase involved in cell wall biosynthesis
VVSTSIGAEGIEYRQSENILIADTAEDFAAAVLKVINDRDLAHRLRTCGRNWVEQNYDWQARYSAWDRIYPHELETL